MEPTGFLPHVDELVLEYLLFRGFTKAGDTFQVFTAERKSDRARGFDVEQIISQLLSYIQNYQIESVLETWKFLSARFFNHLDVSYTTTIHRLEVSLQRLYVVNAIKTGHREKAIEFFKIFISYTRAEIVSALHATIPASDADIGDSWCRWFILPYIQSPETDPYFRVFFTKEWLESFLTSFRNFMSTIFRNLPLPKILAFQMTKLEEPSLKLRLKVSQSECNRLRLYNVEAAEKIKRLESSGRQLHEVLRLMVQHNYLDQFEGADFAATRSKATEGDDRPSLGISPIQFKEMAELFGVDRNQQDQLMRPAMSESMIPIMDESDKEDIIETNSSKDGSFLGREAVGSEDDNDEIVQSGLPPISPPRVRSDPDQREASNRKLGGHSSSRSTSTSGAQVVRHLNPSNSSSVSSEQDASQYAICSYSSDGEYIATSSVDNSQICVWSSSSVVITPTFTIDVSSPLKSFCWYWSDSPQQHLLYSLDDGSIVLWNVDGKEKAYSHSLGDDAYGQLLATGRKSPIVACSVARTQPSGGVSWELHMLNFAARPSEKIVEAHSDTEITCLAWNQAATMLATGSSNGEIRIFRAVSSEPLCVWRASNNLNSGSLSALAFSPDSDALVSYCAVDHEAIEWSTATFADFEASLGGDSDQPVVCPPNIVTAYHLPRTQGCNSYRIRFDPTGKFFGLCTSSVLRLFKRSETSEIEGAFKLASANLTDTDWHPVLPMVCTACDDGSIILWNVKNVTV
ncbi:TPA: hypothetical protein N0F65_006882 [Lagenidium giganteum]|uniref:LisH domain-containing protein n=1 Tax=Lagenidium giganteum TaxID=4803 RepID=A0AAV2ZPK7_9STRA|nr:TPA: hypothetical protein N0F65_006882 [Lagenidium giganteum]